MPVGRTQSPIHDAQAAPATGVVPRGTGRTSESPAEGVGKCGLWGRAHQGQTVHEAERDIWWTAYSFGLLVQSLSPLSFSLQVVTLNLWLVCLQQLWPALSL